MPRWLSIALAGVAALTVSVAIGTRPLAVAGAALVAAAVLSQVTLRAARRGLRADGHVDAIGVQAGGTATVRVRLYGWPARAGLWRLLSISGDLGLTAFGAVRAMTVTARGGGVDLTWTVETLRRGVHALGDVRVRVGDPLGIGHVDVPVIGLGSVEVGPRIIDGPTSPARYATSRGGLLRDTNRSAIGELLGVRNYRPGDPLNRIHWPQTARRRRLQTSERAGADPDPGRTWVLLDAGPGTDDHRVTECFELAVTAAASVALRLARVGGLAAFEHCGAPRELLRAGSDLRARVWRSATGVRPGGPVVVADRVSSLARSMASTRTLVLVTPLGRPELVSAVEGALRSGLRVLVLLIGGEAATLEGELTRLGCTVICAASESETARALDGEPTRRVRPVWGGVA